MRMGMGTFGLCGLGLAAAIGLGADAGAQDKVVRWKMQSAFPATLDVVGEGGPVLSRNLERISDGKLNVKFFEPGALVPPLQTLDAVHKGSIEAAWTTAGFHAGKIPSAPFFTTVPFGPNAGEFFAWLNYGGGDQLKEEIYGRFNAYAPNCGVIAPEASGWFRKEIKTAEDLRGLKMRFFGLGAKVMEKLGVTTQLIAPGDVYPALELGTIDAAELAFPSLDLKAGFHQVAKHYYFPGWHQQSSVLEFLMNKPKWEELSAQHKAMIEVACGENIRWMFSTSEARQFKALEEIKSKGVTIHHWPTDILARMRTAWDEVVREESAKDADFKRTYESYAAFREKYAIWRKHGYMTE